MESLKTKLFLRDYISVIREAFASDRLASIDVIGTSMSPTLLEGDKVVLTKPIDIKKYDIVLYKVNDDTYYLHRVVQCGDIMKIRGDNNIITESVPVGSIIAKVLRIVRSDGNTIEAGTMRYNNYARRSNIRRFFRRVRNKLTHE